MGCDADFCEQNVKENNRSLLPAQSCLQKCSMYFVHNSSRQLTYLCDMLACVSHNSFHVKVVALLLMLYFSQLICAYFLHERSKENKHARRNSNDILLITVFTILDSNVPLIVTHLIFTARNKNCSAFYCDMQLNCHISKNEKYNALDCSLTTFFFLRDKISGCLFSLGKKLSK